MWVVTSRLRTPYIKEDENRKEDGYKKESKARQKHRSSPKRHHKSRASHNTSQEESFQEEDNDGVEYIPPKYYVSSIYFTFSESDHPNTINHKEVNILTIGDLRSHIKNIYNISQISIIFNGRILYDDILIENIPNINENCPFVIICLNNPKDKQIQLNTVKSISYNEIYISLKNENNEEDEDTEVYQLRFSANDTYNDIRKILSEQIKVSKNKILLFLGGQEITYYEAQMITNNKTVLPLKYAIAEYSEDSDSDSDDSNSDSDESSSDYEDSCDDDDILYRSISVSKNGMDYLFTEMKK